MEVTIPTSLPVIPTFNGRVILPGIVVRLVVERRDSIDILSTNKLVATIPCVFKNESKIKSSNAIKSFIPNSEVEINQDIRNVDLFGFGTVCRVIQVTATRDSIIVKLEGLVRFKTLEFKDMMASMDIYSEPEFDSQDLELKAAVQTFRQYSKELVEALRNLRLPAVVLKQLTTMLQGTAVGQLCDLLASMIDLSYNERLEILASFDLKQRLLKMIQLIKRQLQVPLVNF